MKISRVEVLCANRAVYAKVYTDNGLYGIGESGAWGLLAASGEAIKMFGEYLVGQDPLDIEHHWQYMYRFSHFRGAAVMGAIRSVRSRPMRCCSSVQRPTISQFVNTRIRMRRPLPII